MPSRYAVRPRSDPRRRLILAYMEQASGSLDLTPDAPSGNKGTGKGHVSEIGRDRFAQHSAQPRGRHHPAIGAAILVQPGVHLRKPLAETAGWNLDLNANCEAPLRRRDHLARITRHRSSLSFDIGRTHQ